MRDAVSLVVGGDARRGWSSLPHTLPRAREELYRLLLMVVLLVQVTLLMFIPYVGSTLSFLLCW